jgi:hypothetical protein
MQYLFFEAGEFIVEMMIKRSAVIVIATCFCFIRPMNSDEYLRGVSISPGTYCNLENYSATTQSIKDIFIGRCNYFVFVIQKNNCHFNSSMYDCNEIWKSFYLAVKKPTCSLDYYNALFKITDHYIPPDKSLFWSGGRSMKIYVSLFTKITQYWALEDALAGYLLNTLRFCVSNQSDFIYDSPCPKTIDVFTDCKFLNF